MKAKHIVPINTKDTTLEMVGGKGKSLAKMSSSGFPVPGGFLVTTTAYRQFVEENNLQATIIDLAKPEIVKNTVSFEKASKQIQELIQKAAISEEMMAEIRQAYDALEEDNPPVAVRSSANAEDLPDMSFAGQQDTYLNIRGGDALIKAIQDCWASLWTPRAISYRHQMGIEQEAVAMAVVVQIMVPSDVSGILFTANPATGERSEMIVNASFGLGEAVVGGQVTPDTYIIDRETLKAKETLIGAKEQQIVSDGEQGTRLEDIAEGDRDKSSMSEEDLKGLVSLALDIEKLFEGLPQDMEWAISKGQLYMLQSRPITNLPPQPIEVTWEPTPPAQILARRQIVENIPDPCSPLFEELYLTEGLETPEKGKKRPALMIGGGPMFVTVNGFGYQRFDFKQVLDEREKKSKTLTENEMEAAEQRAAETAKWVSKMNENTAKMEQHDLELFLSELSPEDRKAFDDWAETSGIEDLAHQVTMPKSDNPTYIAFNKTEVNENQLKGWYDKARPTILATAEEWRKVDPKTASDEELLEGVRDLTMAGGMYWASNASHTFGVAKSTDSQLQTFLQETLPDHHFTSGLFLSGFKSKTMEANEHLFKISQLIRANNALYELVMTTPPKRMMSALQNHPDGKAAVEAINEYLNIYGHLGYSLDIVEPVPVEDPSGLLATLKTMVSNENYDPKKHEEEAARKREKAMEEVVSLLHGLQYWQFRYRLWFTYRFYHIREEVMFYLTVTSPIVRPIALELGQRLVDVGTFTAPDDIFYLFTEELTKAIEARKDNKAIAEYKQLAAERRELREARKRLHPPGTLPQEASELASVRFKETQTRNDPNSDTLMGVPVSPGKITGQVSLIQSPAEFDKMIPGSILVCPMTNPAWTPLFAHATGLVTDMGGILGHGSIVAREYGIPAVVGTGTITQRVKHGQMIEVDGNTGTVKLLKDAPVK